MPFMFYFQHCPPENVIIKMEIFPARTHDAFMKWMDVMKWNVWIRKMKML